jgi:hypothetical protein
METRNNRRTARTLAQPANEQPQQQQPTDEQQPDPAKGNEQQQGDAGAGEQQQQQGEQGKQQPDASSSAGAGAGASSSSSAGEQQQGSAGDAGAGAGGEQPPATPPAVYGSFLRASRWVNASASQDARWTRNQLAAPVALGVVNGRVVMVRDMTPDEQGKGKGRDGEAHPTPSGEWAVPAALRPTDAPTLTLAIDPASAGSADGLVALVGSILRGLGLETETLAEREAGAQKAARAGQKGLRATHGAALEVALGVLANPAQALMAGMYWMPQPGATQPVALALADAAKRDGMEVYPGLTRAYTLAQGASAKQPEPIRATLAAFAALLGLGAQPAQQQPQQQPDAGAGAGAGAVKQPATVGA